MPRRFIARGNVALILLSSGNEPRNAGLHNGIEPHMRLNSFVDLSHRVFRKRGDIIVFLEPTGSLCGGQERRPALDTKKVENELLFLPTNLTSGIEASDDPIINTRTEAYAESFGRRTK